MTTVAQGWFIAAHIGATPGEAIPEARIDPLPSDL
jgi:hypothetical protein